MLKVLPNILYIWYVFEEIFWTGKNFGHNFEFILFCLYITLVITVSASLGGFSIDLLCKLIHWSLCDLDALIEVYSSYLLYVLFILFIYLFALCYICFCLLILLILLFVVVDVVVASSFFNSFYCSSSGFSMYFIFVGYPYFAVYVATVN